MSSLQKLMRASQQVRWGIYVALLLALLICLYGYIVEGELWLTMGDGQFERLWSQYPNKQPMLALILAPLAFTLLTGLYRLQRSLKFFSQGQFFCTVCINQLKWLAWLSVFGVVYSMLWPLLALPILSEGDSLDININLIIILALLCIPLLVHLMSAAAELERENSEFI